MSLAMLLNGRRFSANSVPGTIVDLCARLTAFLASHAEAAPGIISSS
ncbi:hypothetical protein FHS31_003191 [Sphingomonas vulcanisoli]|uniref:Uncharacterized protein n=1 Tax=Sphingomonas vulcanisoli TaxID=1658060 RepID=A0ABX0TWX6_9SPHN|nr:hypothetical protein [Sphingomonas vulcanisoli]NIJ09558.1 hypothetical protein [Sphingomonas vulcanisoli]